MPTYTPVIDNGGQVYNVRAFGAVGDGTTNDAQAISLALNAARKTGEYGTAGGQGQPVHVPSGIYRVDSPLNMTGSQLNLRGAGPYQTVLRGNTGAVGYGVFIDMAPAGLTTVRDVLVDVVGMPNPSTIGVLQARNPAGAQAHANHLSDVVIRLNHMPSANGFNGTVGIYNVGSEVTTYNSVQLRADIGLYLGSGNNLNASVDPNVPPYQVVSPFTGAIGDNVSMTVVGLRGTSAILALAGPAVRIRGAAAIDLGDASLGSVWYEEPALSGPYPYAIEVLAQTHSLRYSGSMENFPSVLKVHSAMSGLFLECYAAHDPGPAPRVFLAAGATLAGGRIDVVPTAGSNGGTLIKGEPGTGCVVRGVDISLYNQGIDLGNGVLTGCVIRSTRSLADTKTGIVAGTRSGNVIHASDGVHIDGVTPW